MTFKPEEIAWGENEIILVWMLKWSGETDKEVAKQVRKRVKDVKWLIQNHEMFWNTENKPSWLPDKWWERFSDKLDY